MATDFCGKASVGRCVLLLFIVVGGPSRFRLLANFVSLSWIGRAEGRP